MDSFSKELKRAMLDVLQLSEDIAGQVDRTVVTDPAVLRRVENGEIGCGRRARRMHDFPEPDDLMERRYGIGVDAPGKYK